VNQVSQSKNDVVSVGGVVGLDAFEDPAVVSGLKGAGGIGYYTQESGVYAAVDKGDWGGIAAGMAGLGTGQAEINLQAADNIENWLGTIYQSFWIGHGLKPDVWNSIVDFWNDSHWYQDFAATVSAAKAYGVNVVAPIFSPNGDLPRDTWDHTTFAPYLQIQKAALLGGGLTLDTPPAYFYQQGSQYQQFAYQQIQWANANHLYSSVIISPSTDDAYFQQNVARFVEDFEQHGAIPTQWVVENYTDFDPNGVGSVNSANSMAGAAAWVARNAETTTYTPAPSIVLPSSGKGVAAYAVSGVTRIGGTSVPNAKLTVYMQANGVLGKAVGTATADADGNWSFSSNAWPGGTYNIVAVATGANGVASAMSASVSVSGPVAAPAPTPVPVGTGQMVVTALIGHESSLTMGLDASGKGQAQYLNLINHGVHFGTEYSTVSNLAGSGVQETIDNRHAVANLTVYGNAGNTEVYTGAANTTLINDRRGNTGTLTVHSSLGAHNTIGAGVSTVLDAGGQSVVTMGRETGVATSTLEILAGGHVYDPTRTTVSAVGGSGALNVIDDRSGTGVSVASYGQAALRFTGGNAEIALNGTGVATITSAGNDRVHFGAGAASVSVSGGAGDVFYAGSGAMTIDAGQSAGSGCETYIGGQGGTGALTFVGGAASSVLTLGMEKRVAITAGSGAMTISASDAAGFTADLTKSVKADLVLGAGLGNASVYGFDAARDGTRIDHVAGSHAVGGNMVVDLTNGHAVTFYGVTTTQGMVFGG